MLYLAAMSAVRNEPACTACYQRLVADGMPHTVAIVAIVRKLACLLPTLMHEDPLGHVEERCGVEPPRKAGAIPRC